MEKLIINSFVIYVSIATFVLINFLFNPKIHLDIRDKKTGEISEKYTRMLILTGSFYWIIFLPLLLKIQKEE